MPGEVGQGVAVGAVGLPEPAAAGWSGAGELGEAGYQESLGQQGRASASTPVRLRAVLTLRITRI